jgi:hypothetical protein
MVSVEIVEARSIQKSQINGLHRALAACINCLGDQIVNLRAAPASAGNHTLGVRLPVADQTLRERLKERLAEEHYMRVVVHDHAGSLVIGEAPIELKTKLPEKLDRPLQIADR